MSTKQLTNAIRQIVRPSLQDRGFCTQGSKDFCRTVPHAIQVINFQSFNAYKVKFLEITELSFTVNIGIYFTFILHNGTPLQKKCPREYQCHFRWKLKKNILQDECPRTDIWYVLDPLHPCEKEVEDALSSIVERGIPWLEHYSDIEVARHVLQTQHLDTLSEAASAGVGGIGNFNSPLRVSLLKEFEERIS